MMGSPGPMTGGVGFQENQGIIGALVGHLSFVLGIVHAHTHHFGARYDGSQQVCFGQWNALVGRVDAVIERVTGENDEVIVVDNAVERFPALQAKSGDLHDS